mmetsp:Transcript_23305/g.40407  ORF Transcript_23305/g.40407 Transcript_23305/m.40407 type:complete len:212 (-) Transcript_23305:1300-1935(-)
MAPGVFATPFTCAKFAGVMGFPDPVARARLHPTSRVNRLTRACAFLSGDAHGHSRPPVAQRDIRLRALAADQRHKTLMLVKRRSVMIACIQQCRINGDLVNHGSLRGARAGHQFGHRGRTQMSWPEPARAGHECLDLAQRAHSRQLFLISAAFGEHAQLKHRARAAVKIHDDIAAVDDIWGRAIVFLVQVVHGLCSTGHHPDRIRVKGQPH